MNALDPIRVRTGRGTDCRVLVGGPEGGPPVVVLHSAAGLVGDDRFLATLAGSGHRVFAPELPGYGDSTGEELLEDMLDFTLHTWDVVDALDIAQPALVGHSMGGMMAAEMAALCPDRVAALVLVSPLGLWDDEHPIPDIFSLLPFQIAVTLFRDPKAGAALLTGGVDFDDMAALTEFFIGNARRLGTAGKILFPIPNRRLSRRLYRVRAETLLVWGAEDRYVEAVYADRWQSYLPAAKLVVIDDVGHMAPYEDPDRLAAEVAAFVTSTR
ncbi:MAG: alpha/beta fold hydrolase [Acidimicrobiales bacterium]